MSARGRRGFTLIELVVAITVLAFVTMLLYGAFSSMKASRDGLARVQDRYREGRIALEEFSRRFPDYSVEPGGTDRVRSANVRGYRSVWISHR